MLYGFLKGILPTMFRIIYRAEVHGQENVPKEGGAIIAANHISLWDPPFVGAFCPRRVSFMAKKELFENSVFSSIITSLGAFPVNRGAADRNAIKTALTVLGEGKCLGLFPEGTRSKNGKLGEPEAGIGLIAYKANVPIVPVAITGTNGKGLFPKFTIRFGKPIPAGDPKDKKLMTTLPTQIMTEIQKLLDEEQAGR
ncbi:MAG: 1-acyl-sn-glycerol-3-phosphate acyltransferase [Selenomonadales bacterium]|jgi:1-acyl-sn-glycerol-3-phosphate acyltransferase|nr:1-acyl-sn-glycerol-3-phosphate acyltransferase [Selenomonadales bacterium]MBQ2245611.1 1-acyl-sn-glycerol-3-phosphate acyltransferase [Selenomonadales bacterium]MBQ5637008.1 1-acyl-sn-glycerol-3-phosphate acyltransferase [Selenomonadales bacterium]MBR0325039.1 1-acyl-sn-glycerol-3-phosphate acyltransferase [Selenomonadales bacterium]